MLKPSLANALRPVVDHSLNTAIVDRLKDFILREKLRPGDKLPTEGVLSERLQVSRSAVREAMRGLEALGMVEARQGSGRVVREFNFDAIMDSLSYGMVFNDHTVFQVTEVRKALDAFFVEQVVARATEADLADLDALVTEIEAKVKAGKLYEDEDFRFHKRFFEIAGNPLALQLFRITWEVRMSTSVPLTARPPKTRSELLIHTDIARSIRARNVEQARLAVLRHYGYTDGVLARRLAAHSPVAANGANGKHT